MYTVRDWSSRCAYVQVVYKDGEYIGLVGGIDFSLFVPADAKVPAWIRNGIEASY